VTLRRYFASGRTSRFDALEQPLIVTTHIEGVVKGEVVKASDPDSPIAPAKRMSGGAGAELLGYDVVHGEIYRIEGVEHVPRPVTRYVKFDEALGFIDADAEAFQAARASPARELSADEWPALIGTTGQVAWANTLRVQAVSAIERKALGEEQMKAALSALAKIKSARWFIARKEARAAALINELARSAED